MKKTINVNVAGRIFYVEEDAYTLLDSYLTEVKAHFATFEDSEEILKDIETRIAEMLMPASKDAQPIVNKEAVEHVIAQMGSPKDFTETEEGLPKKPSSDKENENPNKRFYRDTESPILGGVSAGIAAYFDIDPLWVRLLFVLATITGGYGILIYIVLWIAIPAANTPSQKVEMRGGKVTLQSVKEQIVDNPKTRKHAHRLGQFVHEVVSALGRFFRKFGGVIIRIIGGIIAFGFSLAIAGVVIAAISAVVGGASPDTTFPLRDFFGTTMLYVAATTAFFIAFIPLMFGMLVGTSMATLKNQFKLAPTVSFFTLWIVAIAIGAGIAARNAPRFETFVNTHPSLRLETTSRTTAEFTTIQVENGVHVTLQTGTTNEVQVKSSVPDQGRIHTEVIDGALRVSTVKANSDWCFFCFHRTPQVYITAPHIEQITAQNAVRIEGTVAANGELRIVTENASTTTLNVNAPSMTIHAQNASRVTVHGTTTTLQATAQNASRIRATELVTRTADARASNGSTVSVQASDSLKATTTHSSHVLYLGTPKQIEGDAEQISSEDNGDYYIPPIPSISPIPTLK